MGFGTEKN